VPAEKLQAEIKQRKLAIERLRGQGLAGHAAARDGGHDRARQRRAGRRRLPVEAKVPHRERQGHLLGDRRARSARAIDGAVRDIANNVIERFPLEGTVIAVEDERYRVNIGRGWRISRGTEFTLTAPTFGEGGKVAGYRETGRMEVRRSEDASSLVDVATLKKGEKVQVGDRVVRRTGSEGGEAGERSYVLLTAKGGVGADVNALPGTNVYLNGEWKGATGTNGQAEIPLRPGKSYSLPAVPPRLPAGRRQAERREERRGARVRPRGQQCAVQDRLRSVPGSRLRRRRAGRQDPAQRRQAGHARLSQRAPLLRRGLPRLLRGDGVQQEGGGPQGRAAEGLPQDRRARARKGRPRRRDQGYGAAGREHPDYAEAHRRLGNIYLDDKEDYDRAIAEFETVLSLPENEQLIYKQFAVTFTNLGHAYAEKGNRLANADRDAASQSFAKAIKALQTAKQNTRFFPKDEYDEAVHDTYYYTALAYHKLYLITRQPAVANSASLAWREYFDFFPRSSRAIRTSRKPARRRAVTATRSRNSELVRALGVFLLAAATLAAAGEEQIEPEFVRALVPSSAAATTRTRFGRPPAT
jgi:tetratricopeptide (TPR) repeat protein